MIYHILEQSFTFLPFALGLFISYTILNKADLAVDGTFVLGGAVYARSLHGGFTPLSALLLAIIAGSIAGIGTSLLQYKERIHHLIAGILALFMLQSANLLIMGRPNISLLSFNISFPVFALSPILIFSLYTLMRSKLGLNLLAFGDNPMLMQLLGYKSEIYRMIGFAISNGLVALSGVLTAQHQGFTDIGMGLGMVLVGLGSIIIGSEILKSSHMFTKIISCTIGTILYFSVVNTLVFLGIHPTFLKLGIGAIIASLLFMNQGKKHVSVAQYS